jgi:hypothetical protein
VSSYFSWPQIFSCVYGKEIIKSGILYSPGPTCRPLPWASLSAAAFAPSLPAWPSLSAVILNPCRSSFAPPHRAILSHPHCDNATKTSMPFPARGPVRALLFMPLAHSPFLPTSTAAIPPRLASCAAAVDQVVDLPIRQNAF